MPITKPARQDDKYSRVLRWSKGANRIISSMKQNSRFAALSMLVDVGETIKVPLEVGKESYLTKVGYDEFVNMETGEIHASRDAFKILHNSQTPLRIVDKRELLNKMDAFGILGSRTKHIEMDIETSYRWN
jgi:hypothetical protein